jgi:hypothetical protein
MPGHQRHTPPACLAEAKAVRPRREPAAAAGHAADRGAILAGAIYGGIWLETVIENLECRNFINFLV